MKPVVEIRNLTKTYKNLRGIHQVNMTVQQGDIYGFFGPNGAGKTSVMKIMAGLTKAQQGEVKLFGYDVSTHYEQAMAKVGVLIETAEAYTYMSGKRNLELAARFYPGIGKQRVDEVLEIVGLTPFQHEKVAGYSLGMKQRLGLAAAMLSKPELLILDEPTNGLDIEGMVHIREIIMHLAREERITFLISSHLIHEMELMCNRMGIIHQGRLVREGLISELSNGSATLEEAYLREINEVRRLAAHA
ncbi:ATP-binding cassette domain-containing protein [Paenibacillus alginolyticus]|uniref:ATP-binding cassette domain-containing protein n=1 Tax=Paenibacillus alginolyticus TaxID=59839 RepID=A0ABT4GGD6_9BACL|nr:ATP-binding cassette domain-containing protein [Paenibacillus alginolyticus]MCY9666932.1 ATP-binding cassette domain-containing protein [Paenibacillus alginolyticus]MCY9695211.1 ATP-binding cassette domain-containing protein [Paenibacillus alginolyticus]MEC0145168.1 ATP-binding cassette domain-containing protein [Paenibacillus alginolyticus]